MKIIRIWPFEITLIERKKPNEFTRAGEAVDAFKAELFKTFKPLLDWLEKRL